MFFRQKLALKDIEPVQFTGNAMKLFAIALVIVGAFFFLSVHLFCPDLHQMEQNISRARTGSPSPFPM